MPHLGVADRVKETTTTTGTGTIDLAGAPEGYQTFVAGIGNGHETYYSITNRDADEWEVGYGTITDAATDTLSRTTVISSSNGGSLVNFSAGTKDVICTLPADRSFVIDDEANVSVTANVTATSFNGSGAALTSLNASNVSSGTLPNARLDAQLQDIAGLATTSGKIIQGDGANFVLSAYTIPTSDGTTGQVLTTNGSGAVTFQTPTVGDITAVTAGSGLTGGGTSGDVTLNVGAGTGVTVGADTVSIGQDVATSASPTFAGGTFTANVAFGDLDFINMGPTGEYQIYHDHANGVSVIKDVDAGGSINMQADTINLTGAVVGSSTVNASTFNGSGAGLTTLNASNVSSGTLADARLTANVTLNNASTISAGTLADARLTANVTLNNASTISAGTLADARLTSNVTLNNASTISTGTLPNARLSSIPNSSLANSSITINGTGVSLGDSINVGDVTGVTAGNGLTGGGTSGDVTLNVGAGTGVTVGADTVSIGQDVATSASPTFAGATFTANVSLSDGDYLRFGAGNDLIIYHDATNSRIEDQGTGDLLIGTSGTKIRLWNQATTGIFAEFKNTGSVDLYYNTSKKFETTSAGITVTGSITTTDNIYIPDADSLYLGSSNDLRLWHDGSNSYIIDQGTGDLNIQGDNLFLKNAAAGENYIRCVSNGDVKLYYDNAEKLATTSAGIDVTGQVLADKAYIAEATLTDGATISWNMSTQSVAKVTLGGNRTLAAPTNGSTGQFCSLNVIQDVTGSRTLTWNAVFEFKDDTAPTLTTTGSKGDIFVFRYNGSKWLEVGRNLNISQS